MNGFTRRQSDAFSGNRKPNKVNSANAKKRVADKRRWLRQDEVPAMQGSLLSHWESDAPYTDALVSEIEHFDARGMRRVYGRGDHFGRHCSFNMDIWKTRDGRLLMRCWSRCEDIDWRSFEIKGVDLAEISESPKCTGFIESWVPGAVRQAYDQWISEEF